MAEQTFKSPGFFDREIDLSQRTASTSLRVPGGIIGISEKGPAFLPTTVGSVSEFIDIFGEIRPEFFGAIAAREFLSIVSSPQPSVTYTRVLGAGVIENSGDLDNFHSFGVVKNAGFSLVGSAASATDDTRHQGCVQFITAKHAVTTNESKAYPVISQNNSVATTTAYFVRSMVLMASGARLQVLDHNQNYTGDPSSVIVNDLAKISPYTGQLKQQGTFKLVISSTLGSTFSRDEGFNGIKIYTASLDPDSDYYVGKVLNTSNNEFHTKQHLLYSDFLLENSIAKVQYDESNATVAVVSGSGFVSNNGDTTKSFRDVFGNFNTRYSNARTTTFISQPFGKKEHDLFHFETLSDGESANKQFVISIADIKKSESKKNPFGSFTVQVRDYKDNDSTPRVVESFNNCNLDINSEDFVGNKIGDLKFFYNFDTTEASERGIASQGTFTNKSKFIRIVLSDQLLKGNIPPTALPFGFKGLPVIKTSDTLGTTTTTNSRLGLSGSLTAFKYSIVPPVPLTFKVTKGNANASATFTGESSQTEQINPDIYWGVKRGRLNKLRAFDGVNGLGDPILQSNSRIRNEPDLVDAFTKFSGIEKLDALVTGSGADLYNNNKFTLARVALNNQSDVNASLAGALSQEITSSSDIHMKDAAYIRNASLNLPNFTINDGAGFTRRLTFASLAAGESATFNKFSKFAKFTNVFYGGFDGLNILDKDARRMNDKASSTADGGKAGGAVVSYQNLSVNSSPGVGLSNNIISSYVEAANVITNARSSEINILIVPDLREKIATNKVSELVKDNSKIIYLMDIPSFDKDDVRLFSDSQNILNIDKTIAKFKARNIDNSFVATYFPDTVIQPTSGRRLTVPASVSAFQALGFNDAVSFPWFAPAGFNRGALSNVVNTTFKLNTQNRDDLYEARINPIAHFANGKVVIFGQKTLQRDRSALDRVNVRRMVLEVKRIVSNIASNFVFEQNTKALRDNFIAQVSPQLSLVQSNQGINKFRVIMDETNNTVQDEERNVLNGTIVIVPTRAVEFIAIDFIITNSGVSF